MARTAVLGRLTWRVATVAANRWETSAARTLVLDVRGWPGHLPGQHVDVKLTAEDGYSAQRSYSIASAPDGDRLELTIQRVVDGEVSPYLVDVAQAGDQFEIRGPVGGYFTWRPVGSGAAAGQSAQPSTVDAGAVMLVAGQSSQPSTVDARPVLLVAGGSGIVPLMAMVRARAAVGSQVPFRLVYSVRSPQDAIYAGELAHRQRDDPGLEITYAYTRTPPPGWTRPPGRLDAALLREVGWPPHRAPACFLCGPTGFVEAAANLLVDAGHPAERIKTERFGPSGG